MNLTKLVSLGIALLFIQACSHPIEIVGEGDVTSASGNRNCSLEQVTAGDPVCSKNYAIGAYQETYYAAPRAGWTFDRWDTYCPNAVPPNYDCSFNMPAEVVYQFWGQTMPPLTAVFCRDIPPTTPTRRFTDHGDSTVTDTETGLMWAKCAAGLSGAACETGATSQLTWQQALNLADGSTQSTYTDWRLPTPEELESIVEQRCDHPSINREMFPNTIPHSFWSSVPDDGEVWVVDFDDGETVHDPADAHDPVRFVRDAEINTPVDTDHDGTPDNADTDDDNDGRPDGDDVCPLDPNCGWGTPITDTVTRNGRVWAQPDLFKNVISFNITPVCPNGSCIEGHVLNGYDMTGWRWANREEVVDLLNSYGISPPLSAANNWFVWPYSVFETTWASAIFASGFRPTDQTLSLNIISGSTSDPGWTTLTDALVPTETGDQAKWTTGHVGSIWVGAWFYR